MNKNKSYYIGLISYIYSLYNFESFILHLFWIDTKDILKDVFFMLIYYTSNLVSHR